MERVWIALMEKILLYNSNLHGQSASECVCMDQVSQVHVINHEVSLDTPETCPGKLSISEHKRMLSYFILSDLMYKNLMAKVTCW